MTEWPSAQSPRRGKVLRRAGLLIAALILLAVGAGVGAWLSLPDRSVVWKQPAAIVEEMTPRAEAGDVQAMVDLTGALGNLGRKEEAGRWRQRAVEVGTIKAEAGDTGVMVALARVLMDLGRYDEARHWWLRAAEAGNRWAQSTVARGYDGGHSYGFSKDPAKAAHWYRRLAEGIEPGTAHVHVRLGEMHRDGIGVAQSDTEAVAWFRTAARHESGYGFLRLAEMTAAGRGTPRDLKEAYRLAFLAEHGRPEDDSDFRMGNEARRLQAELRERIGPDAAADAERHARWQWHHLFEQD